MSEGEIQVVAGLIRKGGLLLIAQRYPDDRNEPGKWEFPGGKVEAGERPEDALMREIMEELGLVIRVGTRFTSVSHTWIIGTEKKSILLLAYDAECVSGTAKAIGVHDFKWVRVSGLREYDFASADVPIVHKLERAAGVAPR